MLEELAVAVPQVQLSRPAKAPGIRHGQAVAVVDLAEEEGIRRVDHEAAEHTRHRVAGQHRAHASAAARDDEIRRLGVEQDAGQQAVHHIGQRGLCPPACTCRSGGPHGPSGSATALSAEWTISDLSTWLFSMMRAIFMVGGAVQIRPCTRHKATVRGAPKDQPAGPRQAQQGAQRRTRSSQHGLARRLGRLRRTPGRRST